MDPTVRAAFAGQCQRRPWGSRGGGKVVRQMLFDMEFVRAIFTFFVFPKREIARWDGIIFALITTTFVLNCVRNYYNHPHTT